jgi:hypothetical protein
MQQTRLEIQNASKNKKPIEKNPNFKTQKAKNQCKNMTSGQTMARTRSKTSKHITKDGQKIEDNKQTKLKPHKREKRLVTNYIVNIKHQDFT